MLEYGIINRNISAAIARQGHTDLLMVTDAGFAIPDWIEVIDLSIDVNKPMVIEILEELKKYFSVEKLIISKSTKDINPSHFKSLKSVWKDAEVELVSQEELRKISKNVKTIIRTGDFTSFGNVILVSGPGNRWYSEQ